MVAVNSVQQIVAALRSQIAQPVRRGQSAPPAATKSRARAKPGAATRPAGLLNDRVQALDPADPQRGRKAFRIFLESVLLDELGEELINDASFYQLVDQVQQTMEQDAGIALAIEKAVASLLQAPSARRPVP